MGFLWVFISSLLKVQNSNIFCAWALT